MVQVQGRTNFCWRWWAFWTTVDKHNIRNTAKVREAILADQRQTIYNVFEIVGLSYGTVQCILVDNLNMRCISARYVPRLLSNDQKAHRVSVCRELKQQASDDPNFISNIITGNETWVYGYDLETKQQLQWKSPNSPRPKKACQVHSNVKSMLIVFSDIQGIVHKEFVSPGQTVNCKCYCEVLKWLWEGIWHKRPDKWKNNNWFLHHDNAPAHTSLIVRQFLTSKNITVIPHPLFTWPRPLRLSPIPPEITAERASFWHNWGDPRRIARDYQHTHIWELPGLHEITGNTLGSLYTCPRGLLQRRRWKLGVTVRKFFLTVKFPEFLSSTSYFHLPPMSGYILWPTKLWRWRQNPQHKHCGNFISFTM